MRRTVFLALAGIIVSTGMSTRAAHAVDYRKFIFECKLISVAAKKAVHSTCTAKGRVCSYNAPILTALSEPSNADSRGTCVEKFEVSCDGQLVYSDSAVHTASGGFEFLSGIPGGNPVLRYPSSHPDDDDFVVDSALKVGTSVFDGFCHFRTPMASGLENN